MPQILENCVQSLTSKWKAKPSSRPTPKKDSKGKPQDAKAQAFAICTASLKASGKMEAELISLEGVGPVILGAAATNRPHIGGLPEVSRVEQDGEKLLRIPLLVLGKWRHTSGLLDFTRDVVERMRANFQDNVVGRKVSWDNRHKPELGALAWFKGFRYEEGDDGKKLFVGYARPTPAGDKVIDEERYKYASIEFHPNWETPLVSALSSDEFEPCVEREVIMPDETGVDGVNEEQVIALEADLKKAQDALKLEQEGRTALQDRIVRLEQRSLRQFVDNILLKAEQYRDGENRAHSKVLLDWARAVLLEDPIGEGEGAISLEDRNDATQTRAYYRRAIGTLLESLPGVVPMSSGETDPDKERRLGLESDDYEPTDEEVQEFWGA